VLARATCSGRRDAPRPGLWIIADLAELFQAHVAGSARRPLVVLLQEQRADEAHDRRLVWEDGDDVGAPLDLAVEAFERICNRYVIGGCPDRRPRDPGRSVALPGSWGPGARKAGRPLTFDELRARVCKWPPLRLTRLRCERGSVVVVLPAGSWLFFGNRGVGHACRWA